MSNSPGLIDFAIRLVNSVLNLRDGQVNFLLGGGGWWGVGNSHYRRTLINAQQKYFQTSVNEFWASTC